MYTIGFVLNFNHVYTGDWRQVACFRNMLSCAR